MILERSISASKNMKQLCIKAYWKYMPAWCWAFASINSIYMSKRPYIEICKLDKIFIED